VENMFRDRFLSCDGTHCICSFLREKVKRGGGGKIEPETNWNPLYSGEP